MRRVASRWLTLALLLVGLTPAGRASAERLTGAPAPHLWFDLDLELGGGLRLRGPSALYQQRVRAGITRASQWRFWNLVGTAETFNFDRFAIGVQGEVLDIATGLGAHTGATLSFAHRPGVVVGVGFSVLQIEGQVLFDPQTNFAFTALVRIPIGLLTYARYHPRWDFELPRAGPLD